MPGTPLGVADIDMPAGAPGDDGDEDDRPPGADADMPPGVPEMDMAPGVGGEDDDIPPGDEADTPPGMPANDRPPGDDEDIPPGIDIPPADASSVALRCGTETP